MNLLEARLNDPNITLIQQGVVYSTLIKYGVTKKEICQQRNISRANLNYRLNKVKGKNLNLINAFK